MKNLLILGVIGALGYVIYNQFFRYEFYEGTWVSNKEMTVASMDKVKRMPSKTRNALSSLFGKMVIHVKGDQMEYYFTDNPSDVTKQAIRIQVLSPGRILATSYDALERKDVTREMVFINDCYSIKITKWKFREFLCRKPIF